MYYCRDHFWGPLSESRHLRDSSSVINCRLIAVICYRWRCSIIKGIHWWLKVLLGCQLHESVMKCIRQLLMQYSPLPLPTPAHPYSPHSSTPPAHKGSHACVTVLAQNSSPWQSGFVVGGQKCRPPENYFVNRLRFFYFLTLYPDYAGWHSQWCHDANLIWFWMKYQGAQWCHFLWNFFLHCETSL